MAGKRQIACRRFANIPAENDRTPPQHASAGRVGVSSRHMVPLQLSRPQRNHDFELERDQAIPRFLCRLCLDKGTATPKTDSFRSRGSFQTPSDRKEPRDRAWAGSGHAVVPFAPIGTTGWGCSVIKRFRGSFYAPRSCTRNHGATGICQSSVARRGWVFLTTGVLDFRTGDLARAGALRGENPREEGNTHPLPTAALRPSLNTSA
jgi:hypothetical protein